MLDTVDCTWAKEEGVVHAVEGDGFFSFPFLCGTVFGGGGGSSLKLCWYCLSDMTFFPGISCSEK